LEFKLGPLGTSVTSGLLYMPRVIVRMENLVEWRLTGETEVLGENLPQRHFIHHKSHLTRPGQPQRLTASATTRPLYYLVISYFYTFFFHVSALIDIYYKMLSKTQFSRCYEMECILFWICFLRLLKWSSGLLLAVSGRVSNHVIRYQYELTKPELYVTRRATHSEFRFNCWDKDKHSQYESCSIPHW
jgi:hypothetical protein